VLVAMLLWGLVAGAGARAATDAPITIFAAASTADALRAVSDAYARRGGPRARLVLAASSMLARQILQGAPADLYLSANEAWMDRLGAAGLVAPGSRVDLLGNVLVLIAPADGRLAAAAPAIAPGFPLAAALGSDRLAMGDPAHVPAGIYARATLECLGVWQQVAGRAAYAANARAALALVARGETAAGIVYATDAAIDPGVRVLGAFPADCHDPIVYPLAVIAGRRSPPVEGFYRFLRGPEAARIFRTQGFKVLPDEKG